MTTAQSDAALLKEVIAWRDRPAKADIRGLPAVSVPSLGSLRKAVPEGVAGSTLAAAYAASVRLSQPQALLKKAGVDSLEQLREQPLHACDARARQIAGKSGWLAGGSGAALGIAGAAGLVADAPALLLIGLRALVRIGYCYGERPSPALVAALFALASADTEAEKRLAWQAALTAPAGTDAVAEKADAAVSDAAIRDGLERAAEREFAKQALAGSLQKLGTTLVQRLGMKKAAGALPVIGAVVGGAVNIRFVYLLGEAARMAFAARRLLADGMAAEKLLAAELDQPVAEAKPATRSKPKPRKVAKAKTTTPRRPRPSPVP